MSKWISAAAAIFFSMSCGSVAHAATYNWDFTSASSPSASGQLTVTGSDQVTAMSGTIGGLPITFYSNPNFPSTATLHGVPNTGGADFIYDDFFNPATSSVSVYGILISTGAGANQVFYDLGVDSGNPSPNADLFSITKDGGYVSNEGTFSSSQVAATPLPSSWTLFLAGLVSLGFVSYRTSKNKTVALRSTRT